MSTSTLSRFRGDIKCLIQNKIRPTAGFEPLTFGSRVFRADHIAINHLMTSAKLSYLYVSAAAASTAESTG